MYVMDRRIVKTDAAIYRAFGKCLSEKDYERVSIEDIIEKAEISRSTFYAHFKTKGEVLDSLVRRIFSHVFSASLQQEHSHDFSNESVMDQAHLYTHILYHLRDEKEFVSTILHNSCRDRFFDELRMEITPLIERSIHDGVFAQKDVPEALRLYDARESFLALVRYWFEGDCVISPEQLSTDYIRLNQ